MPHTKPQNRSKNPSNSNYKATIFLLHVSIQKFTPPSIPTVQEHQLHSIKHNGQVQTICLNAFINLIGYLGKITNIYQMCTVNSQKITVTSKCYQQTTVKVSCHFTKQNILYKNDKAQRLKISKIENPSEKCQAIDFLFFLASLWYQDIPNKFHE